MCRRLSIATPGDALSGENGQGSELQRPCVVEQRRLDRLGQLGKWYLKASSWSAVRQITIGDYGGVVFTAWQP